MLREKGMAIVAATWSELSGCSLGTASHLFFLSYFRILVVIFHDTGPQA